MTVDLTACIWSLPVVVIDTETSGLRPDGEACEIAAVRFESGVPVSRFSSLVKPSRPIPAEATKIHGISNEDVASAPSLAEVAGDLLRVCQGAVPCAYSADFDRHMLHAAISGTDCLAFDPSQPWLDVLVLVKHFDRYAKGTGRHKLTSACLRHGIELEGAHRALADAIACGGLLWTFKSKVGSVSAHQLIERCEVRRREQEADFQAWRDREQQMQEGGRG